MLYQTLLKKELQSVAFHYPPILNCSLLQHNNFQILLSFGICFISPLAVWSLQMPSYLYMLSHKKPFSTNRFGFWLKEMDAESFPQCANCLLTVFVKGFCFLKCTWAPQSLTHSRHSRLCLLTWLNSNQLLTSKMK